METSEVIPDTARGVIVLQITDGAGLKLSSIDLTPELLEQTFAHLLAAWSTMDKGAGMPGEAGTWTDVPTIEGAAWKVGARPFDGAVTLGLCPARLGDRELWLNYGFPRHQAEKLRSVLGQALAQFPFQGTG